MCLTILFDTLRNNFSTVIVQRFEAFALPLIRKAMPSLFATNVVGVIPMTQPIGIAYATRFMYNKPD